MRMRGMYLGVHGLSEKSEIFLQKNFLPTKSTKQIQTTVYAALYEHVLTQNKLPIDTWNDLFEVHLRKESFPILNFLIEILRCYIRKMCLKRVMKPWNKFWSTEQMSTNLKEKKLKDWRLRKLHHNISVIYLFFYPGRKNQILRLILLRFTNIWLLLLPEILISQLLTLRVRPVW